MSEREPLLVPQHLHDPPFITHLYLGHFLARWTARMWEFAVGLYMINVWPDSLLLPAVYGVVESSSVAMFGPLIGQWVDRLPYEKVLQLWLVTQNLSFVIAGVAVMVLLAFSEINSTAFTALVVLTNISGAVGILSTLAGTILVERDWVVVISEGHPPTLLTRMNSITRRIDLVCKLLAPVMTGFIISFVSMEASALTLALSATASVWVEYWLFMSFYRGTPPLGEINLKRGLRRSNQVSCEINNQVSTSMTTEQLRSSETSWISRRIEQISKAPYVAAWKVYLQQEAVLAGVSLALLYFTVLSFSTLMTATLEWQGIEAYVIGIARAITAAVGIAATVAYPVLQARISTIRTGLWSIWSQWCCLLLCVGSIWVKHKKLSAYMLMGGVATSRFGLWMFDLAVIQQIQEFKAFCCKCLSSKLQGVIVDQVPESERGVVGGVQNSLQSTLDLLGYVMGIIISDPKDFWELNLISVGGVTAAAFLYTAYLYKMRKHLFHFKKIM